ncbi:RidA family protein [Rhodospirillaceae bacterium KN72]|uniref:RidA family protein n=1 Tax=Pacificispira spongiicola TaxID=2729598 RepID=A0A7Y0HGU1_9PROT|nr:RidA family protein [Pacificispira spongiicola]NMM44709.1 RidA family protein [Pacificispira spongiicola]
MTQMIQRMNPPSLPDAGAIGYSQITTVEPGRMAYISGQVAIDPDGGPVPSGLADQTDIVVRNARAALAAAGATPQDLVMVRVYVVDLTPDRMNASMPSLLALFDGAQPSVTGIGVAALADPQFQIEVEMIARVP